LTAFLEWDFLLLRLPGCYPNFGYHKHACELQTLAPISMMPVKLIPSLLSDYNVPGMGALASRGPMARSNLAEHPTVALLNSKVPGVGTLASRGQVGVGALANRGLVAMSNLEHPTRAMNTDFQRHPTFATAHFSRCTS